MGWLSLSSTAIFGCLLALRRRPIEPFEPRWMWLSTLVAMGCIAGLGIGSCLFAVLLWTGAASRATVVAENIGLLLLAVLALRKLPPAAAQEPQRERRGSKAPWILPVCGLLAIVFLLSGWWFTTAASPHGDWDAFSIWNLRAKFLAGGGDSWRHAVSTGLQAHHLGASHPDYPLLLSGLIAQSWLASGRVDVAVPAAIGLVYALALVALTAGSIAWLRDEKAAWVGLLLLSGSELFASQIASQYADIPLACYVLATVALLAGAVERPAVTALIWAGLLAALGAWTKNEGLVFLLLAAIWCGWRAGRSSLFAFLAGAAPVLALVLFFKSWVAPATAGLFPKTLAEAFGKLSDPQRAWMILRAYATTLWELGPWWAHPIVLALIWVWAAGRVEPARRRQLAVAALPLAMLAADFMVYMVTVADLNWHLGTSVNRLWLQVWPSLVMSLLLLARPGTAQEAAPAGRPQVRRPAGRGGASARRIRR